MLKVIDWLYLRKKTTHQFERLQDNIVGETNRVRRISDGKIFRKIMLYTFKAEESKQLLRITAFMKNNIDVKVEVLNTNGNFNSGIFEINEIEEVFNT